jgi:signal transduction histidine kinase
VIDMDQPKPAGFDEIRREETGRLLERLLLLRALLVPFIVSVIIYVVAFDHTLWRRVMLVLLAIIFTVMTLLERRKVKRVGADRYEPAQLQLFMGIGVVTYLAMTGGIYSPFCAQVLTALTIIVFTYGRKPSQPVALILGAGLIVMAGLQLAGLSLLPPPFVDAAGRLSASHTIVTTCLVLLLCHGSVAYSGAIREMCDRMLQRTLQARDDVLRNNAEQLRAMTTLSGEIAHELKNPLASIKGLTALVEMEPARAPERLRILRQEIERMQAILGEFLDFSRPLVPLSQEEVDLGLVCLDVLDLHEGLASDRNLTLHAPPADGTVLVRCDRRKVQQILINLVQNAIDASPDGGEVRVSVAVEGGEGVVRVLDRGHGIPAELKNRVFEPGVTSKARGSGLGLTIVRLLAEQHGGSVQLSDRDGGGCVAELRLLRQGAVEVAA